MISHTLEEIDTFYCLRIIYVFLYEYAKPNKDSIKIDKITNM